MADFTVTISISVDCDPADSYAVKDALYSFEGFSPRTIECTDNHDEVWFVRSTDVVVACGLHSVYAVVPAGFSEPTESLDDEDDGHGF